MPIVQHEFTNLILEILNYYFPNRGDIVLNSSELLQYLNIKTKAANRGSKSRAGLVNVCRVGNIKDMLIFMVILDFHPPYRILLP
ncbi:hypothetical protein L8106_08451 [Lyngbya sp. PCC 8106]|nr:hypothetical protein L8106_08451 [Lyngbya sp. PCC 8106]